MISLKAVFALFALFSLFSMPPSVRAQQACTEMWCQEGTTIMLESAAWPMGDYTFTVEAHGRKIVCKSHLPFAGCEGNTSCTDDAVTIGESGCAMGPENHSFSSIMLRDVPGSMMLRIDHESGKTFFTETDVDGRCDYPNGRQCDPQPCCSASLSVDVEWE